MGTLQSLWELHEAPIQMALSTHKYTHFGLFSYRYGVASQCLYTEGIYKVPVQRGICKAPGPLHIQRGFFKAQGGLHNHTHTCIFQSFFQHVLGCFTESLYREGFTKLQGAS